MSPELETFGDFGLAWLDASGPNADVVLSTRVRLARNLQGHAYPPRVGAEERLRIFQRVREAVDRTASLQAGRRLDMAEVSPLTRQLLLERHLISQELAGERSTRGVAGSGLFLSETEAFGLMVNEEDHIRLQGLCSGLQLQRAYQRLERLDEELGGQLPFAYHHEFGYLTSCPTNVGTGLRASILVHLPGLVLTKEIGRVLQGINQVGLTFRGLYGEGSEVVGNFFQISNQTTLGKSEDDLIDHLQKIVGRVIHYEMQARGVLLSDAPAVIEDKIWRAFGLLRYARSLSFDEVMNLLSGVRLGVSLKLLPGLSVYTLNKIMIYTQAAHLEQAAGRTLTEAEGDLHRAGYVRRILAAEGDVPTQGDDEPGEGSEEA